ncbi:glycosyltransferase [Microbacterium sp. EYE_5]|uniref:GDSL-type esterase/lipase family protein n=1 Tax=unclassified Microbacterium TaxID=2609290 RepID=UPI002006B43F|nr:MULTISPECIES: GDSL-type esterase/lipase family protein [unclassified Microbacterium]MCK6081834.1 glycosyltransferase [Microbacterium sp. EYE_382]MCK6087104.1 glycosyltransferase [Microbacterium sp. EYE_384]MCK6124918.1 glycosyltransferase [Microbacterium sp. EYE_80]MCK6127867.1 glycosyltransferase [Microbacterium sp. EYE_79]MCK6142788.1 glycosyltransferase [Microbacterium sp. EYE_39]
MRVAVVTESFLPHMNGVTGSVLQVRAQLERLGHEVFIVAPAVRDHDLGMPGRAVPSFPLPTYPAVRLAVPPAASIARDLSRFGADVVHLASPFLLGWQGVLAAESRGIPSVAVYQTDVIAYTGRYGVAKATALAEAQVRRLHRRATLTLAPSAAARAQLTALGVDRVALWGRGVDGDRFRPDRRDEVWRAMVAPGEHIVGYVGRLAPEKQVEDLVALRGIPGVRLVIVGDGPSRPSLERLLPEAIFLGHLGGEALAAAMASFDVFVHPGESETFGQTIQEAQASGVPVVAVGRGGPVDLVRSSVDGWLYRPGDAADLRTRVLDLVGDEIKRRAFASAARTAVAGRTWQSLAERLVEHYQRAAELRRLDGGRRTMAWPRSDIAGTAAATGTDATRRPWARYVALGDSITEGLCDASRMPAGAFRGWADRLANLLAPSTADGRPFRYANLAVRSRRVDDLVREQLPRCLELRPDLVSILIGANDLLAGDRDVDALASRVEDAVARIRAQGADVLLATVFLPDRRGAGLFVRRFARYNARLRQIAARTGAVLLDLENDESLRRLDQWADDRVHLRPRGHRVVAYRAAEVLGVPHADALADLDEAFHIDEDAPEPGSWLRRDAIPWMWRRMRGRSAGDGLTAKQPDYIVIERPAGRQGARR